VVSTGAKMGGWFYFWKIKSKLKDMLKYIFNISFFISWMKFTINHIYNFRN
jgi:hypothetical protein